MHVISRDNPCFYLSSVARNRLAVFRKAEIATIACAALGEARSSGGFALYAYVIMPDHLHVITHSARSSSDTLRFINGIIGRRVIDYLKEHGYQSSSQESCNKKSKHNVTGIPFGTTIRTPGYCDRKDVDGKSSLHSPESGKRGFSRTR